MCLPVSLPSQTRVQGAIVAFFSSSHVLAPAFDPRILLEEIEDERQRQYERNKRVYPALTHGGAAISGITWLPEVALLAVGFDHGGFYLWNPYHPFAPRSVSSWFAVCVLGFSVLRRSLPYSPTTYR